MKRFADILQGVKPRTLRRVAVAVGEDPYVIDAVVAVLDVLVAAEDGKTALDKALVPPVFIPADTPADEIMPAVRLAGRSMGLVKEDIGEVTTDDVLRRIMHAA